MRRLLFVLALSLTAQERDTALDWPVHAQTDDAELGAEYMSRSVLADEGSVPLDGYIAVEMAVFPVKGKALLVSQQQFTLRLNGKGRALLPQFPGMVAGALKYPDWDRVGGMEASAGVGGGVVILGRPQRTERFPGDRRPYEDRLPRRPRAPEDPSGRDPVVKRQPEEVVVAAALPEGEAKGPIRGYLYFPYKGKTSDIRKVELLYKGPDDNAVLPLF